MRIALFTETYLPYINGVVTHVKSLKDGLECAGHTVLVVSARGNIKHHYIDDLNGVLWCPAKEFKQFYNYGLAFPISTTRRRLIERFAPDIIHIHTEFGVGLSGISIAKALKVPLVYTMHTMYDDYLYYVAPKPFIPMLRVMSHRYFRYFAQQANAITGPSQKVQEYFSNCGLIKQVSVVPNPVELDQFKVSLINPDNVSRIKQEYHIAEDELVVCFCGRLGKEKSVDVLLDYFGKMYRKEDQIRLLIFGDGPCKQELIAQAEWLGLSAAVHFVGKVPHEKLIDYYACCDLYITASLSDTNSISMLEAMAIGLPVVHRLDPLNAEQIQAGINGFVFREAEDMYRYLLEFKRYPVEKKIAIKHSVIVSVEQSGQENFARYLLDVYEHLNQSAPAPLEPLKKKHKVSVYEILPVAQLEKLREFSRRKRK